MTDSILNKALEFLGQAEATSSSTPTAEPETEQLTPTHHYAEIAEETAVEEVDERPGPELPVGEAGAGDPLLRANQELASEFPTLIFREDQVDRVVEWARIQTDISLDIETHGSACRKEDFKKEALSFVRGEIRLVQLCAGGKTYTLDAKLLGPENVAGVLRELRGKALFLHNAIFDLPRILRTFRVDLLKEDVRDTMALSRLLRAGQWEYVAAKNGGTVAVEKKHNIRDVLVREIGEEIDKETDHRWDQPLTEERLRYASDDVKHLQRLYHDLLEKVKKDGMLDAYKLIHKVYPLYMRQQVRGVPFDAELYEEMRSRLQKKVGILETQLREHAPITPKAELAASGSGGTIANRRSRKAVTAPSGPWPWQAHL